VNWYPERRAAQLREYDENYPARAAELRELNALYLFGTLGMEAVMRADGTVLVAVDEHWGEPDAPEPVWREATANERTLSIKVASERWPDLATLLPTRSATARDCEVCSGVGTIIDRIYCRACGAMGWIDDQAI
jgi:hypothetical protein